MKVENPVFDESGEVELCNHCPIQPVNLAACSEWLVAHNKTCPTAATYAEAVTFAEAAEKEGR